MRLLMILDNLSHDSGVSSIVINLYKHIDRSKVSVDFLIFKEGNDSYIEEVKKSGSRVYCLSNPLSIKLFVKSYFQLKHFFKTNSKNYDIVHLHSPTLNEFTLKFAKKYGIQNRIIHSHSTMTSLNKIKKIANKVLQRNILSYANHFWSCSTEAAHFLYGKDFCSKHEIVLIKNAVKPELYTFNLDTRLSIRSKLCMDENIIISHVSNFSPIKNVHFLIEPFESAVKKNSKLRLLLIGDGPTLGQVKKIVEEKNLIDYVRFTGRIKNVNEYLNAIDYLVLPSIKEGLPVAVVEAQANGIPCIISDSITKEVNVGNVTFLPLNISKWLVAFESLTYTDINKRNDNCERFKHSVFNIHNEAKRVERLYLGMV